MNMVRHWPVRRILVPPSAEDVLGSFFGRHIHLSSDNYTLESKAGCSSTRAKTGMRPSDSSSSLQKACLGNIVPLSHQRRVSEQHSHAASAQRRVCAEHAHSSDTVTQSSPHGPQSRMAPLAVMRPVAAAAPEPNQVVSKRDVTKEEFAQSPWGEQLLSWMREASPLAQ